MFTLWFSTVLLLITLLKQVCSWRLRFNLWSEEEWRTYDAVTKHRDSVWTTVAGELRAKMPEGFMLELDGNNKACLLADEDVRMNLTVPISGAKLNWTTLFFFFLTSHSCCTFCLIPGGDWQLAFSLLIRQWVHIFYSRDVTEMYHRHLSHNWLKKHVSFAE